MSDWWYYYGGFVFWAGFLIITITGAFIWAYRYDKKDDEHHDKMNAICAPSFFVDEERAADHLTRVKCLSEQGEKKEILIKGEVK